MAPAPLMSDGEAAGARGRQVALQELEGPPPQRRGLGGLESLEEGNVLSRYELAKPRHAARCVIGDVRRALPQPAPASLLGDSRPPARLAKYGAEVGAEAEVLVGSLAYEPAELARHPNEPPVGIDEGGRPPRLLERHGELGEGTFERAVGRLRGAHEVETSAPIGAARERTHPFLRQRVRGGRCLAGPRVI
jgi:hypothetical protein